MNIDISSILPSLGTIIASAVALITMWNKFQNRIDNLCVSDEKQEKRIDDIVVWSHAHEKEASDQRERFNKEISEMRGGLIAANEQFKQIMFMLTDIRDRMLVIENKRTK